VQDVRKRVLDGSLTKRGKRGPDKSIFSLVREHHYSFFGDSTNLSADNKNLMRQLAYNFKKWWGDIQFERASNFEPPLESGDQDFTSSASASRKRSCLGDMGLRGKVRHLVDVD
jgi:hypothetical protein